MSKSKMSSVERAKLVKRAAKFADDITYYGIANFMGAILAQFGGDDYIIGKDAAKLLKDIQAHRQPRGP